MPTILAIETTTELASAALLHGERLLLREAPSVQTHSQNILPMVQSLLGEAGIALADCAAIAFGAGPGSFTGVRTGCGIAQGLAYGANLPVVPVVSLLAMAETARERTGAVDALCLLDARMGEVYWAQYRFDGEWRIVSAPALARPEAVAPQGQVLACGNALSIYAPQFSGIDFGFGASADIMPHAAQVARLARVAFARGDTVTPEAAQPIYLRNKVALTTAERQAGAAA
jgi:tRNA threonylcarbamoyladenosine biosynthesis protein TsaB